MYSRISFAFILTIAAVSYTLAQNSGDSFFSGIKVHTIKLQFDQINYWDSLTTYYDQGNEQYMLAKVTINGTVIEKCGVRLKGNSSYSHPNNKKPMKIDFNQYVDAQRYDGLKGLFLNNCFSDPSFIREKMHLDFCRQAGIPAPRGTFAFVYINDIPWGLYSIVEPVDSKFLSSRFGNKDGNLYKAVDAFGGAGAPGQQTTQILSDFVYYGTASSAYTTHYELKNEDSANPWTDLMDVISILNSSSSIATDLSSKVNLKSVYKGIGTDILFASLDSYTESGRNFYVYFNESTKKMEWIIWDTNMSFGGYPGNSSIPESLSLLYTSSAAKRPLIGKIFNNDILKNDYLQTIGEVFNSNFVPDKFFAHIDSIVAVIRPYVIQDAKKQYTLAQFDSNIQSDITITSAGAPGGKSERKPGIKSFITTRAANVKTQLTNYGITDIEDSDYKSGIPSEYSLSQNYPNPFNPETTINYTIPSAGNVKLVVYDALGREVAALVNEYKQAGTYNSTLNTQNLGLSSGVYFYRIQAGDPSSSSGQSFVQTKKMILLK